MGSRAAGREDAFYDVVVVGGGTAGSVVASRLTEDLDRTVCLVEGGPSDVGNAQVLTLRRWQELLGAELDYDYGTVEQPRGNSHIRHSRARVLGGCSSHNTAISFRPLPADFDEWVAAGATGWDHLSMLPYWVRLLTTIQPVAEQDRNPVARDYCAAAADALGLPEVDDFNAGPFTDGVGFLPVAYDPETNTRSSASVAYLHPFLTRPNLTLLTETWAYRLEVAAGADGGRVTGVHVRAADGTEQVVRGDQVVLCAGAIDTPRLLLHSGLGPADELKQLGIDAHADLPGVGANLLDHPESVIVWETAEPVPPTSAMYSDAGMFVRRDPASPVPDLMFHFYQVPFTDNTERLGYPVPAHGVSLTPNVPKPKSVGRLWLASADPAQKPALDFGYFTDPEDADARTLVDGLRLAREVAKTGPLADRLLRECAPGPDVTTDEDLSEYARRAAHTVYHPAGTAAMGSADDQMAVVDPDLRVRGMSNLRIADASVFPTMPTVNPMVTVLMVGERAADLVSLGRAAI